MDGSNDEMREQALDALAGAWNTAIGQGVSRELMVSVALALAYGELVSIYGRDVAENIASRFPDQIKSGQFDRPLDD